MWQVLENYYKCVTKETTMLQLVYNVHICDHAMCAHCHHSLWNAFARSFATQKLSHKANCKTPSSHNEKKKALQLFVKFKPTIIRK
jgi:hypothetical protein